ncbi:MAG: hypothetical protein M1548_06450 [Actinobacteria bacterium]|nr:hypothetical protein [Actinomycetota bacterium]
MKHTMSILGRIIIIVVAGNAVSYAAMLVGAGVFITIYGAEKGPGLLGGILVYFLPPFMAGFLAGLIVRKPTVHYGILANAWIIYLLFLSAIQPYAGPGAAPNWRQLELILFLTIVFLASAGSLIGGIISRNMVARKS